jgi:hypothetical protein
MSLLFVLYVLGVVSFVHNALPKQRAGTVDGRTGRQFLRLHSPPHGTLGCSTLGRVEHCKGMGCARISCFAGLSSQLLRSILLDSIPWQGAPSRHAEDLPAVSGIQGQTHRRPMVSLLRSADSNCRFSPFPPPVRRYWASWGRCDPPDLKNHPR